MTYNILIFFVSKRNLNVNSIFNFFYFRNHSYAVIVYQKTFKAKLYLSYYAIFSYLFDLCKKMSNLLYLKQPSSDYPELLIEIPRYCCSLKFFILFISFYL